MQFSTLSIHANLSMRKWVRYTTCESQGTIFRHVKTCENQHYLKRRVRQRSKHAKFRFKKRSNPLHANFSNRNTNMRISVLQFKTCEFQSYLYTYSYVRTLFVTVWRYIRYTVTNLHPCALLRPGALLLASFFRMLYFCWQFVAMCSLQILFWFVILICVGLLSF